MVCRMTSLLGVFVAKIPPKLEPHPGCLFDAQTVPRERLLTHYLIHSVLYYELDESILTDQEFDELHEMLLTYWDQIEHPHKKLIDIELLNSSSSGFYIEFPSMARGAARWLLGEHKTKLKEMPHGTAQKVDG
jgi:hypothetical protein